MDEATTLRTLTEHFAVQHAGWRPEVTAGLSPPEILPGRVPDDLPAPVPLPDDAVIIGTVRQHVTEPGPVQRIDILLDTPLGVERVRAFYEDRLVRAGWSDVQMQDQHRLLRGGFVHPAAARGMALTATHAAGLRLMLDVHPAAGGTPGAHVSMAAVVYPAGAPWMAGRAVPYMRDTVRYPHGLLPPLQLPPGTTVIADTGPGSSTSDVGSGMDIEADMDQGALAAFFTPQLERAGWTREDAGEEGALTWSTWAVVDPAGAPWRGILHVLRCPDRARRYRLSLVAEWPDLLA